MKITLNLLPKEKKDEVRFRNNCRVGLKLAIIASSAVLVYGFFLLACLQIVDVQKKALADEVKKFDSNSLYVSVREDQDVIKDYNKMAGIIEKGFDQQRMLTPVLEKINSIAGEGITFDSIKIEGQKVNLKGVGKQRDQVIEFKTQLEQIQEFAKVESPISNFTQDKDVSFEFNFELKNKK